MKVYRVGTYYTRGDLASAEGLRAVVAITWPDPGPPVELDMTEEEWSRLVPTAIQMRPEVP